MRKNKNGFQMSNTQKFVMRSLLAIFIPLLILEPIVRWSHKNMFQRFEVQLAQGPVHLILVGSSRVAAAVDADILASDLSDRFKTPITVVNLGRGYSSPHDKYLAFQVLFEKYKVHLKKTWLLIEAPQGLPDEATWSSSWAIEQELGLISTYMKIKDFYQMAFHSSTPPSVAVQIALYRMCRTALMLRKLRDLFVIHSQNWRPSWSVVASKRGNLDLENLVLSEKGGILSTPQGIQSVRQWVHSPERNEDSETSQQTPVHFKDTVWASVIQLAKHYQIRVAFFQPPMSRNDIQQMQFILMKRGPEQAFREVAEQGMVLLPGVLSFPDTDYPDLLHLSPQKSVLFSRALGQAFSGVFPNAF